MNLQTTHNTIIADKNYVERCLVDLAGIKSGMLASSFVRSAKDLLKFVNPTNGLPVLVPHIPGMFDSFQKFKLNSDELKTLIFGSVDVDYIGCQLVIRDSIYIKNFTLKSSFQDKLDAYTDEILFAQKKIQQLVQEFTSVGAFQTRNIPHLGHEKIIDRMLDHCELVVINPMLGPKKADDIDTEKLNGLYEKVLKQRYQNKIAFVPIRANMFYAGPREAIHHAKLRQWLGFTHFSVGRDHAGAEGVYQDNAATKMVTKYQDKLPIKIITHGGALYCCSCKSIILQGDCDHSKEKLLEVSGSAFRGCLNTQQDYPFASADVQNWASKNLKYLQNQNF